MSAPLSLSDLLAAVDQPEDVLVARLNPVFGLEHGPSGLTARVTVARGSPTRIRAEGPILLGGVAVGDFIRSVERRDGAGVALHLELDRDVQRRRFGSDYLSRDNDRAAPIVANLFDDDDLARGLVPTPRQVTALGTIGRDTLLGATWNVKHLR